METKHLQEFFERIKKLEGKEKVDISTTEDLSIGIMHLISLEEHFFFTATKTGNPEYFDFSNEARQMRKSLMQTLLPNHEGETWCASKHLLGATMRLIEVANKLHSENQKKEAEAMFKNAALVYSMFLALKTKLISVKKLAGAEDPNKPWSYDDLMAKLAKCCDE